LYSLNVNTCSSINFDDGLLFGALSTLSVSEKAAERKLLSKSSRNEFIQSIKSRLAVAQVVEGTGSHSFRTSLIILFNCSTCWLHGLYNFFFMTGVRASAVLSFDFIMFVLLAGYVFRKSFQSIIIRIQIRMETVLRIQYLLHEGLFYSIPSSYFIFYLFNYLVGVMCFLFKFKWNTWRHLAMVMISVAEIA